MFWLFALPFLASWVHVGGLSPGLKAQVNQKGLEYGREFGLRMVKSMLKNDTIPDIHGAHDAPLLGKVQFSVTGIQINELQLDDSIISFAKGLGVNLTVQNGGVLLNANWKLRTLFGPDGGTVDITVSALSLSAVLGISKDVKGRPVVWAARCRAGIGDLRVKFHGGNSWFYNRFTSVLEVILQAKLNKQLCFEIKKGTDDFARVLRAMNVSVQINSFAELDYSLVNKPFFGANRCQVDFKGEFFSPGQPRINVFTPSSFLLPKQPDSMLLLGISEFFANSAALLYFRTGALQRNITDEMIPKGFPIRLNTENMGMVIPELEKKFPDMPLEVQVGARKQPEFSFHPDGVHMKIFGSVEVSVILPNASLAPAFLLNIDGNFTGQFFLEPVSSGISIGKLLGTVALKHFQVSQGWSNVGHIEMKFLENALTVAVQVGLLSINKHLKKGIVLPNIHNVSLVNPQIAMYQGLMLVATDLHYQPPAAVLSL
ncbi:bactericidal permeability-increasing protein-like [Eublepharis macularius]|uniref:Bactericidal permeability-increasing protein n=1 Tax=Eublepharis macularius TaxID=481883 RepID=A0AA97JDH7_EUBMA|nr:bactericidal permeability-increasing protein-like [Eublepharis macularius]